MTTPEGPVQSGKSRELLKKGAGAVGLLCLAGATTYLVTNDRDNSVARDGQPAITTPATEGAYRCAETDYESSIQSSELPLVTAIDGQQAQALEAQLVGSQDYETSQMVIAEALNPFGAQVFVDTLPTDVEYSHQTDALNQSLLDGSLRNVIESMQEMHPTLLRFALDGTSIYFVGDLQNDEGDDEIAIWIPQGDGDALLLSTNADVDTGWAFEWGVSAILTNKLCAAGISSSPFHDLNPGGFVYHDDLPPTNRPTLTEYYDTIDRPYSVFSTYAAMESSFDDYLYTLKNLILTVPNGIEYAQGTTCNGDGSKSVQDPVCQKAGRILTDIRQVIGPEVASDLSMRTFGTSE